MCSRCNKFTLVADCQRPHFAMMAFKLLYTLKLWPSYSVLPLCHPNETYLVCIPVLNQTVLAYRPEVVRAFFKLNLHDRVVVRKQRSMAIAKVETPDFDVLVGRTGNNELRIARDVY